MKIAYITQTYPPMVSGAALVAERLACGMVKRGHDVMVFAASQSGEKAHTCEGNIRFVWLRSYTTPIRVGQRFAVWSRKEILSQLADFKPEIIHIHEPFLLGLTGIEFGRDTGVPVVLTIHQLPHFVAAYFPPLPGLGDAVENLLWSYSDWFIRQCDALVVPTETVSNKIWEENRIPVQVISNGIDLEKYHPKPKDFDERETLCKRYGLSPSLPIILTVGRLDTDKKVDVVIRAAARVMDAMDVQLLIVGDGSERKNLEKLCVKLGVQNRTVFTGFVPPDGDLPGLYRLATVFGIASEIETQGLVVLEAFASGVPVVAVRATCLPEAVFDGYNGYLTPKGGLVAMSNRFLEILNDLELRNLLGDNGRNWVQKHALDRTIDDYEALYYELSRSENATRRWLNVDSNEMV